MLTLRKVPVQHILTPCTHPTVGCKKQNKTSLLVLFCAADMVWSLEREAERPPLSLILPRLYLGAESDVTQVRQGCSWRRGGGRLETDPTLCGNLCPPVQEQCRKKYRKKHEVWHDEKITTLIWEYSTICFYNK